MRLSRKLFVTFAVIQLTLLWLGILAYYNVEGILAAIAQQTLGSAAELVQTKTRSTQNWIIIINVFAALVSGALQAWLHFSVTKPLAAVIAQMTEGARQMTGAAEQIAGTSQSLAGGANQQAASLQDTTASLAELTRQTQQNEVSAGEANSMAHAVQQTVERSAAGMQRMRTAIEEISGAANETAKIVKSIDEIAFQTNLLALNASVEAARAGDAGKGFTVVAEEVRGLAQRSAGEARNTAELIQRSQQTALHGVAASQDVAGELDEIRINAGRLAELLSGVAVAGTEQSRRIERIHEAVTEIDRVTQGTAAAAQQSAAAGQELDAQAVVLMSTIGRLVRVVNGQTSAV